MSDRKSFVWKQWLSQHDETSLQFGEFLKLILTLLMITMGVGGLKQWGLFQGLELRVYDRMVQLRPYHQPDPRLLVVEITETDINRLKQWPLSDEIIAQVLAKLQQEQAAVIGLDIARNVPQEPGHQALIEQMKQPNFIAVMSVGNSEADRILPPPRVPPQQVGTVDVPLDPDGVSRRHLMFNWDGKINRLSLPLRLVLTYLNADCPGYTPLHSSIPCKNIKPKLNQNLDYQLGSIAFPKLKPNDGSYQSVIGGSQILVNYRHAPDAIRQVSLIDVLEGKVNSAWIKDKIVLIGVSAPSLRDSVLTPLNTGNNRMPKLPGVVNLAQMTSQLLSVVLEEESLFWFLSERQELLWILIWAIAGLILSEFSSRYSYLLLGTGLLLTALGGISFLVFLNQGWIPLISPSVALILTVILGVINREYQSQKQQKTVMRLLGQQTSPEIADALWKGRSNLLESGRLPWQKLTATVFFSDIKNFSTLSEAESPEFIMGWLNEYLNIITEEVQTHHGIVNKFMGDGVMAVFGVPVASKTEAEIATKAQQAVNCALSIRQRLETVNQDWQKRGLPVVEMRVGIFTGPVVVGSLGGKNRLEYGVIGDSVNTASRLESCLKERQVDTCRILIAYETLIYLNEQYNVEFWGELPLKGKLQKIKVYRVINHLHENSNSTS
ncbi:Adenylate cyclase 1 [Planktothrix tepida]|uniref:Adenylate cyclase n=1 Tax=Planktothrix tepida PCC 9214 TaxID=671072 RepID=A0A1J1LK73_9CYAN|nr:adenylate/guanylate cyclase domain-containing protein [Planktothrix tepida]CAD5944675.1 Adenylate cyclase 1 [Planktothrix tepida]CUR32875.1 Adenylate cyclase [Planktothrix tepida PCC 9214]